jgi:CHASE3 domain sensor protein
MFKNLTINQKIIIGFSLLLIIGLINPLKNLLKDRMVKREYTNTNPRTRRTKNENQTSSETLDGLPQVQFTKKIRL